jgi:predicted GNAT superfamily acetyltransferase
MHLLHHAARKDRGVSLDDAQAAIAAAEARARVDVRELTTLAEAQEAEWLLSAVWGRPVDAPTLATDLLRAFSTTGNYVAGAWRADELLGVAVGMYGQAAERAYLYSVVTGVRSGDQAAHVGFALKQHQRAWALARDLDLIRWTFDPLVRRNAYFNLTKLGAEVTGYQEDFYGPMDDVFNRGDESDRCVVSWWIASDRAARAAAGDMSFSASDEVVDSLGTRVLEEGPDGYPVCHAANGPVVLAWVPDDIVAMRAHAPDRARAWRLGARETLGRAIDGDYTGVAMIRSGWYLLEAR